MSVPDKDNLYDKLDELKNAVNAVENKDALGLSDDNFENYKKLLDQLLNYLYDIKKLYETDGKSELAAKLQLNGGYIEQILTNLASAQGSELIIVLDVFEQICKGYENEGNKDEKIKKALSHFFRGGYITLDDNTYYKRWNACGQTNTDHYTKRVSSHHSDKGIDQYSIQGKLVTEALFGTNNGRTWIQLESHPAKISSFSPKDILDLVGHGASYLIYKATGRNVGPYGTSPITENKPYNKNQQKADDGLIVKGYKCLAAKYREYYDAPPPTIKSTTANITTLKNE